MRWRGSPASGKGRSIQTLAATLLATAMACADPVAAREITWQVEDPFRLFTDPSAAAQHRQALDGLPPEDRARPVLAVERQLALAAPRGWAEAWLASTCWSDQAQRYTCAEHVDYAHPTHHRVVVGFPEGPNDICTWIVTDPDKATSDPPMRTS